MIFIYNEAFQSKTNKYITDFLNIDSGVIYVGCLLLKHNGISYDFFPKKYTITDKPFSIFFVSLKPGVAEPYVLVGDLNPDDRYEGNFLGQYALEIKAAERTLLIQRATSPEFRVEMQKNIESMRNINFSELDEIKNMEVLKK